MRKEYMVPKHSSNSLTIFRTVCEDVSVTWEGLLSVGMKLTLNRLIRAIREAMIF